MAMRIPPSSWDSGFGMDCDLREYVEQLSPEVLLAPSEVGGAIQIELHLLGQLIVLRQIIQLDDDDTGNAIFQGLSVGRVELQKAPLAFEKISEKRNTVYQHRRNRIHFIIIRLLVIE
ncbi:hypothetical protein CEXT_252351 [Caerostris extrusa]|uniref:Uncharacterized protein n=1 Tax=Caerostris extrusa TaxID=172846 RepID=A0AAV4QJV6_CAEEX|nr:hypothetical protein CEXT_252351 [Caerostris extrusa]